MAAWRWYITISAVRQWMRLTHRAGEMEDDNPDFVAAQNELGELSMSARLAPDASERQRDGASVYRGRVLVRGRSVRVECIVMPPQRSEGPLPRLARVTRK